MALLELDDVSKAFGSLKAVDGVSFKVEAGEIFGIAGPNGSGRIVAFRSRIREVWKLVLESAIAMPAACRWASADGISGLRGGGSELSDEAGSA